MTIKNEIKDNSCNIEINVSDTGKGIDEETKKIIDTAYNRAMQILNDNVDKLHSVAAVLLEKEKIDSEEFEAIFNEE